MKEHKGFTVIEGVIVIALVAAIGGLGWWAYQGSHKKTAKVAVKSQSSTTSQPSPSATTTDPHAGWKVYSENNLNFKYPRDWSLEEQTVGPILRSADFASKGLQSITVTSGASIMVSQTSIPNSDITAENYQSSSLYGPPFFNLKTKTINGHKVVQFNISDDIIGTVFFRTNGTRIEVRSQYSKSNQESSLSTYNLLLGTVAVN